MGGVALRALVSGLVDYAGLFPPAALDMCDAVDRYATYRRGQRSWMLGRFVVPVARLGELEAGLRRVAPGRDSTRWRVSALAASADEAGLASEIGAIDDFNARQATGDAGESVRALVDAVELRAPSPASVEEAARLLAGRFQGVYEVGVGHPAFDAALGAIGAVRGFAKLRTGGVVADAIPPVEAVATFVCECASRRVPFKVTAGLHHPLRGRHPLTYEATAPSAVMHGFLNLFVAASFAWSAADSASADTRAAVAAILSETAPEAFAFDEAAAWWREVRLPVSSIEAFRRGGGVAFGSCSFEEPVEGLEALGHLR